MLIIPLSIAVIFDKLKITKWEYKIIFGLFPLLDTFLLHFRGNDANLSKLWHLPQLLGIGIFAINGFFPKNSLKKVEKIYGYLFCFGYLLPFIYPIWAPSLSDEEDVTLKKKLLPSFFLLAIALSWRSLLSFFELLNSFGARIFRIEIDYKA